MSPAKTRSASAHSTSPKTHARPARQRDYSPAVGDERPSKKRNTGSSDKKSSSKVKESRRSEPNRQSIDSQRSRFSESGRTLTFEDLDLNVSYINRPALPGKRRHGRWVQKGPAINHPLKVPAGWTSEEPDLDPNDLDAQIARCEERISDNILPALFKHNMEGFKKQKEQKMALLSKHQGLDEITAGHLEFLLPIKEWLEVPGNDDPQQLENVKAIIKAYHKKFLIWAKGLVTYWSHGKQVSQPRPFKWEEFRLLQEKYGSQSLWVEGITGPGFPNMNVAHSQWNKYTKHPGPDNPAYMNITVSLDTSCFGGGHMFPGEDGNLPLTKEFEFMHDTGSDFMMIYEEDVRLLQELEIAAGKKPTKLVSVGTTTVNTVNGEFHAHLFLISVQVETIPPDPENRRYRQFPRTLAGWDNIYCIVRPGSINDPGATPRVDGRWIRYRCFTGSVPDGSGDFIITNSKGTLMNYMPTVADLVRPEMPTGGVGRVYPATAPAPWAPYPRGYAPGSTVPSPASVPVPAPAPPITTATGAAAFPAFPSNIPPAGYYPASSTGYYLGPSGYPTGHGNIDPALLQYPSGSPAPIPMAYPVGPSPRESEEDLANQNLAQLLTQFTNDADEYPVWQPDHWMGA